MVSPRQLGSVGGCGYQGNACGRRGSGPEIFHLTVPGRASPVSKRLHLGPNPVNRKPHRPVDFVRGRGTRVHDEGTSRPLRSCSATLGP
jgi:hypothetical protein